MPFIVSLMSQGLGNGHMKPMALGLLLHVTKAESLEPLSDPSTEISLWEGNQDLQSQLAKCKQELRDLREKFLMTRATACSLANQLKKHSDSSRAMVTTVRLWGYRMASRARPGL
ncbi:NBPF family member NBPF1-like [Manis javanica]|uniref:NBPF family member NBPF1-like n=1 Tax=Manis javanica TaxID=9974 RepID=UPI003C6D27A2